MSSYQNVNTARRPKNVPGRIQCCVCKTFKNIEIYSKKEQRKAHYDAKSMRCPACTGTQRLELECLKCGDVLPIAKFSKSSKKAGGNQFCIECTIYKEAALPDNEQNEADEPVAGWDGSKLMTNLSLGNSEYSYAASSTLLGRDATSGAPTFNNIGEASSAVATRLRALRDANGHGVPMMGNYVPPHERKTAAQLANELDNKSVSSASNIYEDAQSSVTASVANVEPEPDWVPVNTTRKQFNGWGPQGQCRTQYTSGDASTVTKTPVATPSLASASAALSFNRHGTSSFAKPTGNRSGTTWHTGFDAPQPKEHHNRDDDSDSDDFDDP